MKIIENNFSHRIFFSIYLFVFCVLFTAYCLLFSSTANAASPTQVCLKDQCVTIELADTDAARARGLQDRTSMPVDHGMLFVFPSEDVFNFWMKDTLIPLDMIWINEALIVVDIKGGLPPCASDPCPVYVPSGRARFVLEVNANFAQTHGLKVGDPVVIK